MSDTPTTSVAADVARPEKSTAPLGMNTAVDILGQLDAPTAEEPVAAGPSAGDQVNSEPETESPDQTDETGEGEPSASTEDQTEEPAESEEPVEGEESAETEEPEPKSEDEELVHGNMKTRLRDGTVVTVGQLKKDAEEARELREYVPQLQARAQQIQAQESQLAQQQQEVQAALEQVSQVFRNIIPPPPDPQMRIEDPVRWMQLDGDHRDAVARWQQINAQYETQRLQGQQQQEQARVAQLQQLVTHGQKFLREKIPELSDPAKSEEFQRDFSNVAKTYGFTPEEVSAVYDPRLIYMVIDREKKIKELSQKAAAYDKLISQRKSANQKTTGVPPMSKPGARVAPGDQQRRGLDQKMEQWRQKGGGMPGAVDILSQIE
jgi:hypothetical protein